jgi:hypothetical protein
LASDSLFEISFCGACSTHRRHEKYIQHITQTILKGRDHLGDVGLDKRILLKWIIKDNDKQQKVGLYLSKYKEKWKRSVMKYEEE